MDKALDWNSGLPASNNKPVVKAVKTETKAAVTPVVKKEDKLPEIVSFSDMLRNGVEEPPELVSGILRLGCKMMITGDSKGGKSMIAQQLAVNLATGTAFMDKFKCRKARVVYCNMELQSYTIVRRMKSICDAMNANPEDLQLDFWNLRGYAAPIETLVDVIVQRCKEGKYDVVIFDPIYKLQSGDENSAGDIAQFCNAIDRICEESGASVIYVHHHSKKMYEKTIDRASGSGVFARDCDALLDISSLALSDEQKITFKEKLEEGAQPLNYSFVLRDFKAINDVQGWFEYPVHKFDSDGLSGTALEGSGKANLRQNGKGPGTRAAQLDKAFNEAQLPNAPGVADIKTLAKVAGRDEKTIRRWVNENANYEIHGSMIYIVKDFSDEEKADFPEGFWEQRVQAPRNINGEEIDTLRGKSQAEIDEMWKEHNAKQGYKWNEEKGKYEQE